MSEINVVPYIDVMLVLLVIFMITAPLLTQGVQVDLPRTAADPIEQVEKEPLIVTVDEDGRYYVSIGDDQDKSIDHEELVHRVAAVMKYSPGTPVLVKGDEAATYGKVAVAMALLQKAGVPSVGLLTDSPETESTR